MWPSTSEISVITIVSLSLERVPVRTPRVSSVKKFTIPRDDRNETAGTRHSSSHDRFPARRDEDAGIAIVALAPARHRVGRGADHGHQRFPAHGVGLAAAARATPHGADSRRTPTPIGFR